MPLLTNRLALRGECVDLKAHKGVLVLKGVPITTADSLIVLRFNCMLPRRFGFARVNMKAVGDVYQAEDEYRVKRSQMAHKAELYLADDNVRKVDVWLESDRDICLSGFVSSVTQMSNATPKE